MAMKDEYDLIIVGGRPAGASLAARLGAAGHRVLLLERARFPSLPAVPSSPALYPSGMHMLDDLGIPEADYAAATVQMDRLKIQFSDRFAAPFAVPELWGRSYVCALDRQIFDEVLWRNLERFDSVERREGFAVTDLLRDESGRVVGVVGREGSGGVVEELRARCIVGADGRFSLVARKAGAPITEAEDRFCSTVYFATWDGVTLPEARCGFLFASGRGLDVLLLPLPGGRLQVNTHHRADRAVIDGDAQGYYRRMLAAVPGVEDFLRGGSQRDDLVGIKRIGNGYRQSGGDGWLLVGDAVHYKDPADGQGIYDALLETKLLAEILDPWLKGASGHDWARVVDDWKRALLEATRPMYLETVARLQRELYDEPPEFAVKTLVRWTMTDPAYQEQFMRYLSRDISPTGWNSPKLMIGALARGLWRDITGRSRASAR